MSQDLPTISLIIPTRNRRHMLPRTLSALAGQQYPGDCLEAIVVADGCSDGTATYVADYARHGDCPFPVQCIALSAGGPAAARNHGAGAARGRRLIFLDDDMEAAPGFVAAHVRAGDDAPLTVVIGSVPLAPRSGSCYFADSLGAWWTRRAFEVRQPGYRFRYSDLISGNMSLPAALFHKVGGFNADLRCHEDYELGLRLLRHGATFRYAEEAEAVHHDATGARKALQRRRLEGAADVTLARLYPGLGWTLPLSEGPPSLLGRCLRRLAFDSPTAGNALAFLVGRPLALLERLHLRGSWQALFYHLQDYWYWRGVADLAARDQFRGLLATPPAGAAPDLLVDLAAGLDPAADLLERRRPTSVRFTIGGQWLADLPSEPGVEKLRADHLRRLLATDLAEGTAIGLALRQLLSANNGIPHPNWPAAAPGQPARTAATRSGSYRHFRLREPKRVVAVDLDRGTPDIELVEASGTYALIRLSGLPLGVVTLAGNGPHIPGSVLAQEVARELGPRLVAEAWGPGRLDPEPWPSISVVVCTRDRPDSLRGCLEALGALNYPEYEVLVIDNASTVPLPGALDMGSRTRLIREERPGLDWARNRGWQEACHEVVAYIDDDARPDPGWLMALARDLADPEVAIVTGPVLPVSLDADSENLFEFGYGGMSHGFRRRIVRLRTSTTADLLWASSFGVGTNMAFRRRVLADSGGFDVALDVGTPACGGGDVEMFHRLVASGYTLVYEPEALVWHRHRSRPADLRRQMRDNGRSFGAYLITAARRGTVGRRSLVAFAIRQWLCGWMGRRLLRPDGFPRGLILSEVGGALSAPAAYVAAQRQARRIAGQHAASSEGVVWGSAGSGKECGK